MLREIMGVRQDEPHTERELALMLRARRCDALIVASSLPPEDPFYAGLMESGTPVIAVDRALKSPSGSGPGGSAAPAKEHRA